MYIASGTEQAEMPHFDRDLVSPTKFNQASYKLAASLKEILMNYWVVIQNQSLLKSIYTKTPVISYKRGKSLKDMLVRAKI